MLRQHPPDAFTVTERRFTSNADRRIVAQRQRDFSRPTRAGSGALARRQFTEIHIRQTRLPTEWGS
jgi:hypothetical protein